MSILVELAQIRHSKLQSGERPGKMIVRLNSGDCLRLLVKFNGERVDRFKPQPEQSEQYKLNELAIQYARNGKLDRLHACILNLHRVFGMTIKPDWDATNEA